MPLSPRTIIAVVSVSLWCGCAALPGGQDPRIEVIETKPTLEAIASADVRRRIADTGLPWRVRHRASGVELVLIPPGSYLRGASDASASEPRTAAATVQENRADNVPPHQVILTRPFYIGRYEVTNAQYRAHDSAHTSVPDEQRHAGPAFEGLSLDDADQPAVRLSWYDAASFTERFGLRLPREAEWEYACRAGTQTRYPWGDAPEDGAAWANLANPSMQERFGGVLREMIVLPFEDGHLVTAPVGRLRGNGFGVHDMIGNAWEWTDDWYDANEYRRSVASGGVDPHGPKTGEKKVLRGSSWQSEFAGSTTCFFRGQTRPEAKGVLYRGFRVAMDPVNVRPES